MKSQQHKMKEEKKNQRIAGKTQVPDENLLIKNLTLELITSPVDESNGERWRERKKKLFHCAGKKIIFCIHCKRAVATVEKKLETHFNLLITELCHSMSITHEKQFSQ